MLPEQCIPCKHNAKKSTNFKSLPSSGKPEQLIYHHILTSPAEGERIQIAGGPTGSAGEQVLI